MSIHCRRKCANDGEVIRILEANNMTFECRFHDLSKGCLTLVFAGDRDVDYWSQSGRVEARGSKAGDIDRLFERAAHPQSETDDSQAAQAPADQTGGRR